VIVPPAVRRPHLLTTWGSVLYIDVVSGELRHGPLDSSPANAVFIAGPPSNGEVRQGWIMHDVGEALEPVVCLADNSWTASRLDPTGGSVSPTIFQVTLAGHDRISLKSGNSYLCAEPDGRLTLSRTACSTWECFVPSDIVPPDPVAAAVPQSGVICHTTMAGGVYPSAPGGESRSPPSQQDPSAQGRRSGADGCFTRRKAIVIGHRGNLANKMFQYMGALTLASLIKDCEIVNVSLPEWGIEIPDDTQDQRFFDNVDLWAWDPFRPQIYDLAAMANRSESIRIMMADHLLRMEFLLAPPVYNRLFPITAQTDFEFTENDLLINIRTGDILSGVAHYPLLPIAFYEELVARTGLRPVFVGQLHPSDYVRQLRLRFPAAIFIESRGARSDFDLIRSAKHIVVAVSTFSWLAAWLSDARTIILPLSGFYNPAHHREIDLLPVDDIRYRFFLFPLNYGMAETDSLKHHERMKTYWKEISRNQVALLKSSAPFLRVPRENYDNGLPTRSARGSQMTFDSVWYAHEYIDAAMEISEGWFEDPLHHYLEVGRLRGYLPTRPPPDGISIDLTLPNLALNHRATQSSRSRWSKGSTLEDDAGNAVNGKPWEEYGFHTEDEHNPWWLVDLGAAAHVHFIRIFNRDRVPEHIHRRASPLVVEFSDDADRWHLMFQTDPGQIFGGYSGGRPLLWGARPPVVARFVRISIPRREILHLAEVEIYGTAHSDRARIS
jgi:hypothetical protein